MCPAHIVQVYSSHQLFSCSTINTAGNTWNLTLIFFWTLFSVNIMQIFMCLTYKHFCGNNVATSCSWHTCFCIYLNRGASESQRGKCNCSLMKILIINKFLLSQKFFCNFSDECLCRVVDTCSVMHSLIGSQCMVSQITWGRHLGIQIFLFPSLLICISTHCIHIHEYIFESFS